MKKPTLATLKGFIRKNQSTLHILVKSRFDGMVDGCTETKETAFKPATFGAGFDKNTLGVSGVWVVGGSRNSITEYENDGFFGYRVYNCCGSFVVAVPKLSQAA